MPLTDLAAPIAALRLLTTFRGSLPAPTIEATPIYPQQLRLAFHGDPGGFEDWLDALDIDRTAVIEHVQSSGTRVRKAATAYAGTDIQLVSYAQEEAA